MGEGAITIISRFSFAYKACKKVGRLITRRSAIEIKGCELIGEFHRNQALRPPTFLLHIGNAWARRKTHFKADKVKGERD